MKRLKYTVRNLDGEVVFVSYSEDQAYIRLTS